MFTIGLGAVEFENAVSTFYASREQTNQLEQPSEADLLFSDAPPTSSTVIDETFLNTVWDWLEKHPDIEIRNLDEELESEPELASNRTHQRIFTNEEIAWHVIAGHGVDYSRIPRKSFDCLSVIAAHGPGGVLQPNIVRITGQDKRSVPKRTDLLAENGYIVKLQAYDGKNKTSLLKLRKFAEADGSLKPISELERTRIFPEADSLVEQDDDERDQTYDDMIRMLQENDNIVAIVDLCYAFKLKKNSALKKEFLLSVDRFVETGCARLVKALVQSGNNRYTQCLQLVREPTDQDREAFTGTSTDQGPTENGRGESLVDQDVEDEQTDGELDETTGHDNAEVRQRIPPRWTPDVLQDNLIFNIIDIAGPAGISSMELHKRSMGSFWKKSLDDLLLRLTDVWQVSQPSHLKHLGIVRDTEVDGRNQHFHFRTFPHFQKAVEMGLTSWEAVTDNGRDPSKGKKRGQSSKSAPLPDVDEYGFPKPNPKLFADEEGRASLAQCAATARKARSRTTDLANTPTKSAPQLVEETPPSIPTKSKTGRKKRKDAGIRRGPLGSRLAPRSLESANLETPTGLERGDSNAEVGANGPAIVPSLSQAKRKATDAQVADPPRAAKTRRVLRLAKSSPIIYDDEDTEDLIQDLIQDPIQDPIRDAVPDAVQTQMNQREVTDSKVYFNSPYALGMRFENRHGPGRKPSTKIAIFKFDRLKELPFLNPNGAGSVLRREDEVERIEVETEEVADEPPRKKTKFNDESMQSTILENTIEEPSSSPVVKKKRGRPPKRRPEGLGGLVATPVPSVPTIGIASPDQTTISPAEAATCVVKLPIGKGMLEEFVKQWRETDVETSNSNDRPKRTAIDQPTRATRVSTMESTADQDSTMNSRDEMDRSPKSATNLEPLVANLPGKSLIVKIALPHSVQSASLKAGGETEPAQSSSLPKATTRPIPGLNIVRPYFDPPSAIEIANAAQTSSSTRTSHDKGTSIRHANDPAVSSAQAGEDFESLTRPVDGESGTRDISVVAADDPDDTAYVDDDDEAFEDLSELVPVDIDGEDSYRMQVNQKAGIPRRGGFTHLRRTTIVMETMRRAGGIFPGDHEMWWPFVTAWQKFYAHLPDRRTVENVVNLLVKQKQLKRFSFTFKDRSGKMVQRHILTEPDISPTSTNVKQIQRSIIDSYPFRYLPKEVDIAKHLRDKARQVPVTQGGTQSVVDDDPKTKNAPHTPTGSRPSKPYTLKRSGGSKLSAYFKDRPVATPSPRITKSASFTPRSILKIQGESTPQRDDTEDDDFGSDSDSEDDTDSDDSLEELSPQQAALQGSFGLDNYSHSPVVTATGQRRGKRPMRTLKVGKEPISIQPTKPIPQQLVKLPNTPLNRCSQVFHATSGTFGTIFSLRRRGGGRPKKVESTVPIVTSNFSAPQGLEEILKRSNALGHKAAGPSDSRVYHFSNEVDGVNAWERAMIIAGRAMNPPLDTIFINHSLKQPHDLAVDQYDNADFEFVEGSLRPFIVDTERRRRKKTMQTKPPQTSGAALTPSTQYSPAYTGPYDGLSVAGHDSSVSTSRSTANLISFNNQGRFPTQPLLSLGSRDSIQTVQKLKPTTSGKTSRQYTYRTRNKGKKRATIDLAQAAGQSADRDSDTEYRPGQQAPAKTTYTRSTKKNLYSKFSPEDFKRLMIAVAVVRMICGGTAALPVTNYDAVALALGSKYDVEEVKHQWQLPRKHGYDLVFAKKLQQAMYEPFLKAYESGRLSRIDFNYLQNTNWTALFSWAETEILPLVEGELLGLLPEERGAVQIVSKVTSPANRAEGLASKSTADLDQNHILEKSWIRAVMITKDEKYNESAASSKLRDIKPEILKMATQEMLASNTIKWKKVDRQQPGRSYKISPHLLSQFKRWPKINDVDFLTSVATARADLVTHFQEHDLIELSTDVTEAQLLVLTNMVAQGHLKMSPVLPERNDDFNAPWRRWSKWGQVGPVYDNEQSEASSLDIKVAYKKTSLFASDHGLRVDVAVPTEPPVFPGESDGRITIWIDVNGTVVEDVWKMVAESILHLLVHTPGCTAKSIERAHHTKLWEWEIDMVLKWMETVGLATRFGAGKEVGDACEGAWRASEWWYCASLVTETRSTVQIDGDAIED